MALPYTSERLTPNPLRGTPLAADAGQLEAVAAFAPDRPATPLVDAPSLAAGLGLAQLLIKDESSRWGLNAFKITGVSYALSRLSTGTAFSRLVCASAGNHGRAVARAARDRGVRCRVHLPIDALPARVDAIRQEGADIAYAETYEQALAAAEADARAHGSLLLSDTSATPDGDSEARLPSFIMHGYMRVFIEAATQWPAQPDAIIVQGGVGGLVGAASAWLATAALDATLIVAEPEGSACLRASALAGAPVVLPSTAPTSMVCLRCARPSMAAWPWVSTGVDGFVTVSDRETDAALSALAAEGIRSAPSGACGLAAAMALAPELRDRTVLVIVTEGE